MLSDSDGNEKDENQVLSDSPDAMSLAEDPPNGNHAHEDSSSEDKHDAEEEEDDISHQEPPEDEHVEKFADVGYDGEEEDEDDGEEDDEEPRFFLGGRGGISYETSYFAIPPNCLGAELPCVCTIRGRPSV